MQGGLDLPSLDIATLWSAVESAAEQADIALYVAAIDTSPRIVYVNERALEIVDRPREELIGSVPWSILREQDQPLVRAMLESPDDVAPGAIDLFVQRPGGKQIPITLATTPMQTTAGLLSFGYFRDVSSERAALAKLRNSEARFRLLVQAAPDGVVILKRGLIVFINPKAARLLGVTVDAAIDKPIGPLLPPHDAALVEDRMAAMVRHGIELEASEYGVRADPNRIIEIKSIVCEWDDGPAVLALARDVSERKALERRLIESDRLAALGTLAAGVAHEINNPLTYAQLSAQLVARTLESLPLTKEVREDLREHLADIDHGIKRIASITQALRSFVTAQDDAEPGAVDLNAIVSRALKMVANEMRHVAELVRESEPVSPVIGHASRLEQVVINILINAIKAIPVDSERRHAIYVSLAQHDDCVTLVIRDTGVGIPKALVSRVFDPFFTTREVGHGMGLGLPLSKSIVEQYGGTLEVSSVEGAGTTVRVHLRAHAAVAAPVAKATVQPQPNPERMRVLVVDDESLIRMVLVRILETSHDVMSAASGEEALALLASNDFDLVLCDVMMRGMSGIEVYRRVVASKPELAARFVFMSGGSIGETIEQQLDELSNSRLGKPFTVEQVLELVATVPRSSR